MTKTSLKNRMKKNELYVGYVDADRANFEQRWLTYGDGTPRIFAKHALDHRILDVTPICTTWKSALKLLWGGRGPVMIPLSMELLGHSAATIRRWACGQRDVEPQTVVDYINEISPPEAVDSDCVRHAQRMVTSQQKWWITANPVGKLSDLLALLESVRDECACFDEDDLIVDHADDLTGDANEYFSSWGDLSELVDDDMPASFGYRRDNIEEDIQHVEELFDVLGGDVVVSALAESPSQASEDR